MKPSWREALSSLAKSLVGALILVTLPTNVAFATPATIQSISSVSSVDEDGNSVFDVSWSFGAGTPPADFFLATCFLSIENDPDFNYSDPYPVPGWGYAFDVNSGLSSVVQTNAASTGSTRITVNNNFPGIYFFRAFASIPAMTASDCDSEQPGVPTTTFKFSQAPFSVLKPTNAYSTSHVAYTDYFMPATADLENLQAVGTHSAPLAQFNLSQQARTLIQIGNPRLTTEIDGVVEQVAQNPKPCSRSLLLDAQYNQAPNRSPAEFGTRLWTDPDVEVGYLTLCSWDNFPITQSEQLDPSFDGRNVVNQIVAEYPIWFPDPTHGYGLSTNPQQLNPQLVTSSPITSELTFNFSTGNAVTGNLSLAKLSDTSAEATWTLPSSQAGADAIQAEWLVWSELGSNVFDSDVSYQASAGELKSRTINNLATTTHSAQLYFESPWSVFRSDPAIVELSRVSIGFDIANYPTTQSDLAARFGYLGQSIVLPTFSFSDVIFTGWHDGSTTYSAGAVYTLGGPVTFSAEYNYWDSRIRAMTLSGDVYLDFELFPAFDPNVHEYYLNLNQHNFLPFTLSFTIPTNGSVQYQLDIANGIGPLINYPSETNQTKSFVVTKEDIRTLFSSPRQDVQLAQLNIFGFSEQTLEEGGSSSSNYVIHIARQPSTITNFSIDFELGPDVTGSTLTIPNSHMRYVTLPGPGNLEREGYGFDGWVDQNNSRYNAGEVILLDQDLVLSPVWQSAELYHLEIDGHEQDLDFPESWVSLPLGEGDPNLVNYSIIAPFSYRLSLRTPEGQLVSRYSNNPALANQNLNATDQTLSTCVTQNNCLSLFRVEIESWATTVSQAISYSFHVMRPTQMGEVCLSVENLETAVSGVERYTCESFPDWIRAPELEDDYGLQQGEYPVWQGYRAGDVRVLTGFRTDVLDVQSHLYGFNERVPVFTDTTIQGVWVQDERAEPNEIILFGQRYEFVDCMSLDEEPREARCMANTANPSELFYPKDDGGHVSYHLAQEFTETWWSATLSSNLFTEFEFGVLGRNGQDLPLEDYGDNMEELNIGMEYLDSDLCPVGNCGAIYNLYLSGDSTFGFNNLDMSFHILRRLSSSAQIAYHFSMAGGTGLSTQSFVGQVGWVTPPNVDGVTKSGAVHRDDWIVSTSHELLTYGSLVPIWFDGQVMSLEWLPAYEARFRDHATGGILSTVYIRQQLNTWSVQNIPTASHPQGRPLLGWTSVSGSVVATTFSPELVITSDVDFYPVWGAIPIAPAPSAPNGFQNNPVVTTPSSSSTTSPASTQSPTASSKSTAIAIGRVSGMTQVAFVLPAKYEGGKATFEVKRWINNRVRYFVISTAVVRAPDGSGRAALNFNFKLQLKPSDFIRIKVGKVTVLGKRLR